MLRIGQGYDIHRLVEGRPLRLGCIELESERGALGHSDGDAAAHAVCDALLGAAGLGDMGRYFPSSDAKWKDVRSATFLAEVAARLRSADATISNIDLTIILEKPRLAPHLDAIRTAISAALGIRTSLLSVKAKSGDGVGEIGAGEAVAAMAVALVEVG